MSLPVHSTRRIVQSDVAALIIRLCLGFVFIAHGSQKLFGAFGGGGIAGTSEFFASLGAAPGTFWAVVVGLVEFVGGVALALGFLSRIAAAFIVVDMVVAIAIYNGQNGYFVETPKGGWEINLILTSLALAILVMGAGLVAVDHLLKSTLAKSRPVLARIV